MRKLCVLLSTLFMFTCVGCSNDPNDELIVGTIQVLGNTTRTIEQIKTQVADTVEAAKKDGKPLAIEKITLAAGKADELKKMAKQLQDIKAAADVRKENITPEQRPEYASRHKATFQRALQEVDKAQKDLEIALNEAGAYNASLTDSEDRAKGASALAELRKKVEDGQREFEVLTKRQM